MLEKKIHPGFLVCPEKSIRECWQCMLMDWRKLQSFNWVHHLLVQVLKNDPQLWMSGTWMKIQHDAKGSIRWNPTSASIVHSKWMSGHGSKERRSLLTSFWHLWSTLRYSCALFRISIDWRIDTQIYLPSRASHHCDDLCLPQIQKIPQLYSKVLRSSTWKNTQEPNLCTEQRSCS